MVPDPVSSGPAGRRVGLDLLRGAAALGVALTHVAFATGVVNEARWDSPLRHLLPRLDVGVPVFFALSGLLVSRPFVRAVAAARPGPRPGPWAARRLARILPLYWAVLAVTLLSTDAALPSVPRLLADTFLLHIYRPEWAIGPITQSWSLGTELAFYAFVPLWFGLAGRFLDGRGVTDRSARLRALATALAGWVLVSLVFRTVAVAVTSTYVVGSGAVDVRGALLTWLPNHLDAFAAGVAVTIWSEAGWRRPGRAGRLGLGALAVVALVAVSTTLDLPPYFTGFDATQTHLRHLLNLVVAAAAVAAVGLAPEPEQRTARAVPPWAARLAAAAGLGSYGLYLWHQWVTERWFELRELPLFGAPFPTTVAVVVVVSAVLAAVGYVAVERPALRAVAAPPESAGSDRRQLGTHPGLDGLRGLAIIAVLATHVVFLDGGRTTWSLRGGFLGVDVFLVLSGFLIGATLLREVDRTGTVALGRFLGRRARRLVPPLAAFLAVHLVVALSLGDPPGEQVLQVVLALGFVTNWQLTVGHQPPYDLVHLWSLAVEAQLYVLCGLAVWATRRHLDRARALIAALVAASVVVATWRIVATRAGGDLTALYERTDLRADSLLVGLAAALVWRSRLVRDDHLRTLGVVGAAALAAAMVFSEAGDRWLFLGGFSVVALAAGATVAAGALDGGPVARWAAWGPLRWVGRVSYSLYLWHLPIYLWVVRALPDAPLGLKAAIAVPGSFAVAAVSQRLVEQRWTSPRQRQTDSSTSSGAVSR